MGGAVTILLTRKYPDLVKGVVLVSPMVKIDDDLMPGECVVSCLKCLNQVVPKKQWVPADDPLDFCFTDPKWLEFARECPVGYQSHFYRAC